MRLLGLLLSAVAPSTGASDDANLVNSTRAIPTATKPGSLASAIKREEDCIARGEKSPST